jgi:hypothetical protein
MEQNKKTKLIIGLVLGVIALCILCVLGVLFVVFVVPSLVFFSVQPSLDTATDNVFQREYNNQTINEKKAPRDTAMMLPGMIAPVTLIAKEARVNETEQVIGITIGDEHRAYIVNAFAPLGQKVVNDLINEIPITVTYCDLHERARVFTSTERGEYLTVGLGGWRNKEMFFYFDNIRFSHSSKNAPLADYPYIITTWGEWLEEHPNSRIYLGDGVIPEDNLSFDSDAPEIDADR